MSAADGGSVGCVGRGFQLHERTKGVNDKVGESQERHEKPGGAAAAAV